MKRSFKVWLIILAAVVVIFDIRAYFLLTSKLVRTNRELEETQTRLGQEQKEKQQIQEELEATRGQLKKVKAELKGTQRELKIVNNKLSGAEKNNLLLVEEKERLEAKLGSLKELKKAIKEVKVEYRKQAFQQHIAKKEHQKEADAQKLTQGNHGFLIKNGQLLYPPKVKIEVSPN
jgi:chromosome segregation ATPase